MDTPEALDTNATFQSRLGIFILKDPTVIERLSDEQAKRLDRLIEANSLQALIYAQVDALKVQNRISPRRIAAWRLARACAHARVEAFRHTLNEIVNTASEEGIPVRLLRATQVAFYLCPRPELRPLSQIEIQTPGERAEELYDCLRGKGFVVVDGASSVADLEYYLPSIDRDGVTVTIYRRSCARLATHEDDPFPMDDAKTEDNPEVPGGELLLILLALKIFEASFYRSLATLLDLHRALSELSMDWNELHKKITQMGVRKQLYAILTLAQEIFDSPVNADFIVRLEKDPTITAEFQANALPLIRELLLQDRVSFEDVGKAKAFFVPPTPLVTADQTQGTQVIPRMQAGLGQ